VSRKTPLRDLTVSPAHPSFIC